MLRVGLTGGLGSGKTLVARIFTELGAHVVSADEMGRALMQPGQRVYEAIVERFGGAALKEDGSLDRGALARIAFQHGQAHALNAIVHPAVVAEQERWAREIFSRDAEAVAIVESALIFEAERWGTAPGWEKRFDKVVLVTASKERKIERFVSRAISSAGAAENRRAEFEADARARLAAQIPDEEKAPRCDYVIENDGEFKGLRHAVERVYLSLRAESGRRAAAGHESV